MVTENEWRSVLPQFVLHDTEEYSEEGESTLYVDLECTICNTIIHKQLGDDNDCFALLPIVDAAILHSIEHGDG